MGAERLVDGAAEPALALDASGRLVAVNDAASALLGRPARDLVGQYCGDVVCAHDSRGARICRDDGCPTLALLSDGQATELHWGTRLRLDGTHVPVSGSAVALPRDLRSGAAVAVLLLRDVGSPQSVDERAGAPAAMGVRLFGRPTGLRDGSPVPVVRRRALELLGLLALAPNGGLRKDQVCDALWTEPPAGSERTHLRVLVHSLRRSLGAGVIRRRDAGDSERLELSRDVWVDATAFANGVTAWLRTESRPPLTRSSQRLDGADTLASLYAGDLDEAGLFGPWAVAHREHLRSLYVSLLREASRLALDTGDLERALDYCCRAVAVDPLRDDVQIALIAVYGRLGRRREALAQYQSYYSALAADLALRPSAAVERALRLALRAS